MSEANHAAHASELARMQQLSGLTWNQWGKLFGVSRRTVHMWSLGAPMNPIHTPRLMELRNFFSAYEGMEPTKVKADLLTMSHGESKFRQLVNQLPQPQPVNKPAFTAKELLGA